MTQTLAACAAESDYKKKAHTVRCTSPRTVGFREDGKTLAWSQKNYNKEYATFQIPCGKCLSCRLENARQTAVRCVHEAQMHKENSFITLTYDEKTVGDGRLRYSEFQKFVKDLRNHLFQNLLNQIFPNLTQAYQRELWKKFDKERQKELYDPIRISVFATGEYGDKRKRPHWHCIIFNWRPSDCRPKYQNSRGDQVYSSATLDKIWANGITEVGSVSFESAGYVARYASKKLVHGKDGEHTYDPISKRSSKNAIGKKWIEKYWPDVFNHGYVVMRGGNKCGVPRYYEKWFKKNHPEKWSHYVTKVKSKIIKEAQEKEEKITLEEKIENLKRSARDGYMMTPVRTRKQSEKIILEQKFENLQKLQKDI